MILRQIPLLVIGLLLSLASARAWAQDSAEVARFIVGFEKTAAVSAEPAQKIFADLYFDRPLTGSGRVRAWGDLRVSSLPRQIHSTLISLPSDITQASAAISIDELTQSGEFLTGLAYCLAKANSGRASVALIASVGAATPINPAKPSQGSSGFLRQYYGGARVASANGTHTFDVAIGQNEAVTGGALRGTVVRFESFYALPTPGGWFYLFGTALVQTAHRGATREESHDLFRIGVGLDLLSLLKALHR